MKIKVLDVSEVNNYIKKITENDFILNNLSVKGEISNLKYHTSGHVYFSLKDDYSKINCVMFKSDALRVSFKLKEGMAVVIRGRVSVYPQTGSLQLYCYEIEEVGIGDLHVKFEKLKNKLLNEGLFDEENKKTLKANSQRIGVVTAETGAAIRDIINVTKRRNTKVDLILYPAKVQGKDGYKTIIDGIKYFNKKENVDVIIIGRGGGSLEELWNFNEEELAYEIFKSKLPIISAVGHEVDYTISDFVADVRAATPSQAAEIAVTSEVLIHNELKAISSLLNKKVEGIIKKEKSDLDNKFKILKLNSPEIKIINSFKDIEELENKLKNSIISVLEKEKRNVLEYSNLLNAHNPLNILNKGYSIIKNKDGIIKSKNDLTENNEIEIYLSDGKIKGELYISGGEGNG
ncbi:MAG: exodeoxyribonuclease VII large subunit [Clostridium sp.]|uniref:exodeoxyribonuclease VII large subunit n=1 Tax=Clostridium sp. TaxID=1506 RepID=UPI003F349BFB